MKALALLITLTATTTFAQEAEKDVLYCSFTEPFISITYDAATGKITENGPEHWDEEKQEFVPEVIAENGRFTVVKTDEYGYDKSFKLYDDKGQVILEAALDFQGSDGMSDRVYPFSAIYHQGSFSGTLHGGCQTEAAPAWDPISLSESLQR